MGDRPILLSAPMVRALLAGTKTQTRRVVKPQPFAVALVPSGNHLFDYREDLSDYSRVVDMKTAVTLCPYGKPGDRLWVRETFAIVPRTAYARSEGVQQTIRPDDPYEHDAAIYREGWDRSTGGFRWRPSIHMPRWASRITLEITGVRVERLQDISEADARAEGASFHDGRDVGRSGWRHDHGDVHANARSAYARLWDDINGPGSWGANPWVWCLEFRRAASAQGEKE